MKEKSPLSKPEASSSFTQKELDKAEAQFEKFNDDVKAMTVDRMNEAPKEEKESQTKISNKEAQKCDALILKPLRTISSKEKFNETYRTQFNHMKERVRFTAENNEIIGESIELWTKSFPGQDAEFWNVPTNKVVEGPRYLAERIRKCVYHRLVMQDTQVTGRDDKGTYFGTLAADKTVHRLDAYPVRNEQSIFMGASNF